MMAGKHYAVIARSSLLESARSRIETTLARFEKEWLRPLPRPVVLEGDLSKPELGLSSDDRCWVRSHCDQILHNAASLIFYRDEDTNEPYRSNVEGTRHVLALAEEARIRVFHHVSTSYVCGLRKDHCLESELDTGQEFGNDYEKSKVESEKMVRSATFLDSLTVYRPAIIIGDSQTGYTSTYHGFFTPLKIAHALTASSTIGVTDGMPLLRAIGFSGHEQKNFVPVDWVSAVMTHIMTNCQHWGKTYHLVPRNRVSVLTSTKVFEEALKRFYREKQWSGDIQSDNNWQKSQDVFRNQMGVYQSYWRDDPTFDDTNVREAAPHLPCPTMNFAPLMRMAMFALENGFGWPKPKPILPPVDLNEKLGQLVTKSHGKVDARMLGLQINGQGGGAWTIRVTDDGTKLLTLLPGLPVTQIPRLYLNAETWQQLHRKLGTPVDAVNRGAVLIESCPKEGFFSRFLENLLETLTL
jgi:thioester reductase-like protein